MQLLQPNRRHLRRSFQSGVWLQLRSSPHQRQLHAKLNRLQLDNQLRDSVFPVVLAPVPPPKSIAADSGQSWGGTGRDGWGEGWDFGEQRQWTNTLLADRTKQPGYCLV